MPRMDHNGFQVHPSFNAKGYEGPSTGMGGNVLFDFGKLGQFLQVDVKFLIRYSGEYLLV